MYSKKALTTIISLLCFYLAFFNVCAGDTDQEFNPDEDTGFYYTIKKGDTLWDLSQKFYSSEWDWPGLWEMNQKIKNPHWIYPGKVIRVYLKDQAPKKKKQAQPIVVKPTIVPKFSFRAMDMVSFIKPEAVTPLGEVLKEEENNIMIGTGDVIFIKLLNNAMLEPGVTYQVFSTEPVEDKKTGFAGIKHLIKAAIEIVENNGRYATAKVTRSAREIREGDFVMDYYDRPDKLIVDNTPDPIDSILLCSEDNDLMINNGFIAFISKGSNDQIKAGQMYTVLQENVKAKSLSEPWYEEYNRRWNKKRQAEAVTLDPLSAGRLIVLHTEETASTVMILNSRFDIQAGNMVQ